MKLNRNLTIGIILTATAGFFALQNGTAPASDEVTKTPSITAPPAIEITDTPTFESCGYMWAYHDAPELTEKINAAIRNISSEASARAELFGEDCVYADGHSTFGATETNFYVQFPVDDLTNEEEFGNWMAQVLPLIVQIPKEEIQGNYGFVMFSFIKSETEGRTLRVPIIKYFNEAKEKSGAELFQFFDIPSVNPT